jgi:hypothetical protein
MGYLQAILLTKIAASRHPVATLEVIEREKVGSEQIGLETLRATGAALE